MAKGDNLLISRSRTRDKMQLLPELAAQRDAASCSLVAMYDTVSLQICIRVILTAAMSSALPSLRKLRGEQVSTFIWLSSDASEEGFSCRESPKEAAVAGQLESRGAKIKSRMIKLQTISARRLNTISGSLSHESRFRNIWECAARRPRAT